MDFAAEAKNLFEQGYNSSQAVFTAGSQQLGLSRETARNRPGAFDQCPEYVRIAAQLAADELDRLNPQSPA